MSYKTSKILAIIVVSLLYIVSLLIALLMVYAGVLGLIRLIMSFNIKDALITSIIAIFFYWVYKTSWHTIQTQLQYS